MKPFFSIVIPTYNRAGLIPIAIESALAQTYSSWELLIVDDGSTDNTGDVVKAYNDDRIKYIPQKNAERSAARNNGIQHATGNYICFLDSDDYYLPNRLQGLYESLEQRHFPVMAFYTGLLLDRDGVLSRRDEKQADENVFNHIASSTIHSQQACVHYQIFNEYKYDVRFHIGEDMELWLRIADKYPFVYLDEQYTVVVVEHDDRSVNVKRYNSYPHQLRMLKTVFAKGHPGHKVSTGVKNLLLSNCYFGIAKYFIYTGNRTKAIANLGKAITADPAHFQNKYRLNIMRQLLMRDGLKKAERLLD